MKKTIKWPLLLLLLTSCQSDQQEEPFPAFELAAVTAQYSRQQVIDMAISKYLSYATSHEPSQGLPISSIAGSQNWQQTTIKWSSGFFPGTLWQLSFASEEQELEFQAQRWSKPLEAHLNWNGHDLGFLINNSFGKGARLQAKPEYIENTILAAENLLGRFNHKVGATRSWNAGDFTVIIDNMMNLALLFDASRLSTNEDFYSAAYEHALTTAREFVRSNGSSFHVVHFNESSGNATKKTTAQGLSDNSTWARGQAWGIYGFSLAAKETGDNALLNTARIMANYYLNHLPSDYIPYWDFDVSGSEEPKDTSAAAIAAVGLWMLGKQSQAPESETYLNASRQIVNALLKDQYLDMDENHDALLKHVTGNRPGNYEVAVSLTYADYYLLEAILLQEGMSEWPL